MDENNSMMTVEECAKLLHSNPQRIREAIENGTFPFGICYLTEKKTKVYKISRTAFNRWYNGETIKAS